MELLRNFEINGYKAALEFYPRSLSNLAHYDLNIEHDLVNIAYMKACITEVDSDVKIYGSSVSPPYRNQKLGISMYVWFVDYLLDLGFVVNSDNMVSPSAMNIYAALKRRGYQIVDNPTIEPINQNHPTIHRVTTDRQPLFKILNNGIT